MQSSLHDATSLLAFALRVNATMSIIVSDWLCFQEKEIRWRDGPENSITEPVEVPGPGCLSSIVRDEIG